MPANPAPPVPPSDLAGDEAADGFGVARFALAPGEAGNFPGCRPAFSALSFVHLRALGLIHWPAPQLEPARVEVA